WCFRCSCRSGRLTGPVMECGLRANGAGDLPGDRSSRHGRDTSHSCVQWWWSRSRYPGHLEYHFRGDLAVQPTHWSTCATNCSGHFCGDRWGSYGYSCFCFAPSTSTHTTARDVTSLLRKGKNAMATKSPRRTKPIPQLPAKPSLNEVEEE